MRIIRVHNPSQTHGDFLRMNLRAACLVAIAAVAGAGVAGAEPEGFLETVHRHSLVTSTIAPNGDQNPYAVIVSPVDAGKLHKDDVLVTNFNNSGNLQGLGTTIVDWNPSTRRLSTFAAIPRHLPSCPGGVGLTTAMAVLKTGWVIVGSLPSQDGTTATKGPGCLLILDSNGNVAGTIAGPSIDGPWGNMAVIDNGSSATLFVSMTGFGVEAPGQDTVHNATVLRLDLAGACVRPASDDEADCDCQRLRGARRQGRVRHRTHWPGARR